MTNLDVSKLSNGDIEHIARKSNSAKIKAKQLTARRIKVLQEELTWSDSRMALSMGLSKATYKHKIQTGEFLISEILVFLINAKLPPEIFFRLILIELEKNIYWNK